MEKLGERQIPFPPGKQGGFGSLREGDYQDAIREHGKPILPCVPMATNLVWDIWERAFRCPACRHRVLQPPPAFIGDSFLEEGEWQRWYPPQGTTQYRELSWRHGASALCDRMINCHYYWGKGSYLTEKECAWGFWLLFVAQKFFGTSQNKPELYHTED